MTHTHTGEKKWGNRKNCEIECKSERWREVRRVIFYAGLCTSNKWQMQQSAPADLHTYLQAYVCILGLS